MPVKKKVERLSHEENEQVAQVFQYLVSDVFGGEKYKRYYLTDAHNLVKDHVDNQLRNSTTMSSNVIRKCQEVRKDVLRSKNMTKILEYLSEACLLDEEPSDY